MGLMDLIGMVAGGPILGMIGSGITAFVAFKEKQLELEAQEKKYAHEVNLTTLNIQARGQEMENEAWIAQVGAVSDMLKGSYEHDASYGPVSKKNAAALRWVRPGLTGMLILLTTAVFFASDGDEKKSIAIMIVVMTEAAITWWFADRRKSLAKNG